MQLISAGSCPRIDTRIETISVDRRVVQFAIGTRFVFLWICRDFPLRHLSVGLVGFPSLRDQGNPHACDPLVISHRETDGR